MVEKRNFTEGFKSRAPEEALRGDKDKGMLLRIIIVLVSLVCSASKAFGQEKMLANYAVMSDLRCTGGFLATDAF